MIRIVPSFTYSESLGLVSRSVGPFTAGVDADVPLWLAMTLRRRGLARIVPPDWMNETLLERILAFERDPNEASFSPELPHRHAEVARAVLGDQDAPELDRVRTLLEDIAAVRADKIRRNVHELSARTLGREDRRGRVPVIDVTGIGSAELIAVRPFLATAFRDHARLAARPRSAAANSRTAAAASDGRGGPGRSSNETEDRTTSRIRRFR